jgi:hypothetical protein
MSPNDHSPARTSTPATATDAADMAQVEYSLSLYIPDAVVSSGTLPVRPR